MRKNKAVLLALVSTAMLSAAVYAGDKDGRPGAGRHFGGPGFGMPDAAMITGRMADYLELDDAQRDSVENIMSAAKPELQALRDKTRANHEALRTLAAGDPEVQNIAISNGELATEGTLLFARIRGEIDAVLTDEQRAKFAEAQARRKERGKERKEQR